MKKESGINEEKDISSSAHPFAVVFNSCRLDCDCSQRHLSHIGFVVDALKNKPQED